MRTLKLLGVAVIAVLAMSAVVASAANATNFTASSYPTAAISTSEKGNDDFKTEAGSVECASTKTWFVRAGPSPSWTVEVHYSTCQAFGFLSATVNMNGCHLVLTLPGGKVDLNCSIGKVITVTASTCEATIGSQENLESVALSNSGTGISEKANVGGIKYTVTKDGFLCPFNGTGAKTGATYTQNKAVQISSTNGATIDIG
jgi:hypothetical protein